jgi:hypothetical protein
VRCEPGITFMHPLAVVRQTRPRRPGEQCQIRAEEAFGHVEQPVVGHDAAPGGVASHQVVGELLAPAVWVAGLESGEVAAHHVHCLEVQDTTKHGVPEALVLLSLGQSTVVHRWMLADAVQAARGRSTGVPSGRVTRQAPSGPRMER